MCSARRGSPSASARNLSSSALRAFAVLTERFCVRAQLVSTAILPRSERSAGVSTHSSTPMRGRTSGILLSPIQREAGAPRWEDRQGYRHLLATQRGKDSCPASKAIAALNGSTAPEYFVVQRGFGVSALFGAQSV